MGILKSLANKQSGNWLKTELDAELERRTSSAEWTQIDPNIHPSGSVHSCTRYIALGMLGYRGKFDISTQRKMDNGTYMHHRWQDYFANIPSFLAAEVPVRGEGVKGTCDIILKDEPEHRLIVGELKSISSFGYSMLPQKADSEEDNFTWMAKHYPAYAAQIQLYMHNVEYEDYLPPEKGFFLFESKNEQNYRIFWVKKDTDALNKLLLNARIAQSSIQAHQLPEAPFDKTDKICKTCNRSALCFQLQNNDPKAWMSINKRLDKV